MIVYLLLRALTFCAIAAPFYILARFIFLKVKKAPINIKREILLFIFFEYIVVLISLTLIVRSIWFGRVQLVPFQTIMRYVNGRTFTQTAFINLPMNIAIFVPLGTLLPLTWKNLKAFWKVFLISSAFIILIEFLQYFIGRASDIDDYILNILGVIIGYVLYRLYTWKIKST
jgi:Glycopeptide antibiotics resistance protein